MLDCGINMVSGIALQEPVMAEKLKTEICPACKFHTVWKKIKAQKKEVWVCAECGRVAEGVKR